MNVFDAAYALADSISRYTEHENLTQYDDIRIVEVGFPGDKQSTKEDKSFRITFDPVGEGNEEEYVSFTVTVES